MRYGAGCRSGWTARARSPITRLIRRISTPTSCLEAAAGPRRARGRRSTGAVIASSRGLRAAELAPRRRRSVVRSGTSLMNSTQTSARTANGRATRKMCPVASPKALSKIARTGAGRVDEVRDLAGVVAARPRRLGVRPWPGQARLHRVGDLVGQHRARAPRCRSSRRGSGRTRRPSWPRPCRTGRCCSAPRARGSAWWRRGRGRGPP